MCAESCEILIQPNGFYLRKCHNKNEPARSTGHAGHSYDNAVPRALGHEYNGAGVRDTGAGVAVGCDTRKPGGLARRLQGAQVNDAAADHCPPGRY